MGYRKVFATVPLDNVAAQQYLLASGYRIEAHLDRPYHPKHDELALGYVLDHARGPGPEFIRQITPAECFEQVSEPTPEVASFFQAEFSSGYCKVPEGWATRQLRLACCNQDKAFKPRYMFTASGDRLLAVALCLLKRGGSAKLVMVSGTGHQPSLTHFITFAERQICECCHGQIRRAYTQIPINDTDLIQAFLDAGYRPEGVIEQAYSANSDTLVLGKQM